MSPSPDCRRRAWLSPHRRRCKLAFRLALIVASMCCIWQADEFAFLIWINRLPAQKVAFGHLVRSMPARHIPLLIDLAHHASGERRRESCLLLGRHGDIRSLRLLIHSLPNDRSVWPETLVAIEDIIQRLDHDASRPLLWSYFRALHGECRNSQQCWKAWALTNTALR